MHTLQDLASFRWAALNTLAWVSFLCMRKMQPDRNDPIICCVLHSELRRVERATARTRIIIRLRQFERLAETLCSSTQ